MDSQQTAGNAVESTSVRGGNTVKLNPPLAPAFRARPPGPPGLQRQLVNNGPIGHPRPGGQPHDVRFDGRFALGAVNSGQFVQPRSHGPARPPGNTFPPKLQQGQNPPIVLNPRLAPSAVYRGGFQQGTRPPHPANFHPQELRNVQRFPQPGLEHQNIPQQVRNPELLARQQEFAQKKLQRNASLLTISQRSFSVKEEERKFPSPRAVDKMADIDSAKKLQQLENSATKEKGGNTDNDDDDDVVMNNKKPLSANNAVSKQPGLIDSKMADAKEAVEPEKKSEAAAINGKMDAKPEEKTVKEMDIRIEDSSASVKKEETERHSNENNHSDSLARQKLEKVDNNVNDRVEKTDEHKSAIMKTDSVKDVPTKTTQENPSSTPVAAKDKTNNSDDSCSDKATENLSNKSSNEQNTSQSGTLDSVQKGQSEVQVSLNKSDTPAPPITIQNPSKEEQKGESKSANENAPCSLTGVNQNKNEQDEVSAKLEDKSRVKSAVGKDESVEDTKVTTEPSIKPSAPIEADKSQREDQSKNAASSDKLPADSVTEAKQNETTELKALDKCDSKIPPSPLKSNADLKSDESVQEVNTAQKDSNKSEPSETIEVKPLENEKTLQVLKSPEKPEKPEKPPSIELCCPQNKEELKSEASKEAVNKTKHDSPNAVDESSAKDSPAIIEGGTDTVQSSEEGHLEKPENSKSIENLPATRISSATKTPISPEVTNKSSEQTEEREKLTAPELMQLPPKSPDESVKGFDNGQRRSLSVKSSSPCSPRSPLSPKSPDKNESTINDDKKENDSVEVSKQETDKKSAESKSVSKPSTPKVPRAQTPANLDEKSRKKSLRSPELENGNATNEPTESCTTPTTNGVSDSPLKKSPSKSKEADKRSTAGSPVKSPSKSVKSLPRTPETPSSTSGQEKKKVSMNKVQVGAAPSPNLKTVRSKIGSLDNASYKPGGGKVKIENRKLDFSKAQPKIAAKNEKYTPSGGDKKIAQVKLQWNAKPKVGSLDNATYKPGGGDKKIETVKLDFKDKAKSKVGSKDNAKHVPGGGSVKSSATPPKTPQDTGDDIQTQKLDIKAESKIGSLDNVKHKPGGGDKKIFNDKDYLRQTGSNVESLSGSGSQVKNLEENESSIEQLKNNLPQPPPTTPTKTQSIPLTSSAVTPKAVRSSLAKSPETTASKKNLFSENTEAKNATGTNLNLENCKNITKEKGMKLRTSPRPPNSLHLKSPDKSTYTPRKASPKELRLPKLAPSPTPQEPTSTSEMHSKIILPKLIESSTESMHNAH